MTWIGIVAGLYPLGRAWHANRHTSLRDALVWAALAWLSWGLPLAFLESREAVFLALSMTGCAGVAVLGARRPHVFAWNFVCFGLLGVLLLPLLEGWVIGASSLDTLRLFFLGTTLGISIVNYVPTRFGAAAALLGLAASAWFGELLRPGILGEPVARAVGTTGILLVPWVAWCVPGRKTTNELERLWLRLRDGWGLVWGQRVREQFNQAATNQGLSIRLGWSGPYGATDPTQTESAARLFDAVARRFLEPMAPPADGAPAA